MRIGTFAVALSVVVLAGVAPHAFADEPVRSDQFRLEVSGLDVPQRQIRAVEIDDVVVELTSVGRHQGRECALPSGVRHGQLRITTSGSPALSDWASRVAGGTDDARTVALHVVRSGSPAFTYTFQGVVPREFTSVPGNAERKTLDCAYASLSTEGDGLGRVDAPHEWEWTSGGAFKPKSWDESAVSVTPDAFGRATTADTSGDGDLWRFTPRTRGVGGEVLRALDELGRGLDRRPAQEHVLRDAGGVETGRRQYFESFLSRYTFPRFDRDTPVNVFEEVTWLSPLVRDADGPDVFVGPALYLHLREPVFTDDFVLELDSVDLTDVQDGILSIAIGDITTRLAPITPMSGPPMVVPTSLEYGDLTITCRDAEPLLAWAETYANDPEYRFSGSVVVLGPDHQERLRYNLFEIVPKSVSTGPVGLSTVVCGVDLVEPDAVSRSGTGLPALGLPLDWEAGGLGEAGGFAALLDWSEGLVQIRDGSVQASTSPGTGDLWRFSARTIGIQPALLDFVQGYADGVDYVRNQSRIFRDDAGNETRRRNYFEAFASRYTFPRFDRRRSSVLSEEVSWLAPSVGDGNGQEVLRGSPLYTHFLDPIFTDDFVLEIAGSGLTDLVETQERILSVEIGDITTKLVSLTTADGSELVLPASIEYGNVTITSRGVDALTGWAQSYTGGPDDEPRSGSVVVLGRDGEERLRYNLFELTPTSVTSASDGLTTVVCRVASVEMQEARSGSAAPGVPEAGLPSEWEWDGIAAFPSLLEWTDQLVEVRDSHVVPAVDGEPGDLWQFSVRTLGVHPGTLDFVRGYAEGRGLEAPRAHTRIRYAADGAEASRTNYFDAFASRYTFPRFDRANRAVLSERLTWLVPNVEADDRRSIFAGSPVYRRLRKPVFSDGFELEIAGLNLPSQEQVVSVDIGDLWTRLEKVDGTITPHSLELGDLSVTTRGSTVLSTWFETDQSDPRMAVLKVFSRDGEEQCRYVFVGVVPVALTPGPDGNGRETLRCRVADLRLEGNGGGGLEEPLPPEWEWAGRVEAAPLLAWSEREVLARKGDRGFTVDPVSTGNGNYWRFSVRTLGVHGKNVTTLLNEYDRHRAFFGTHARHVRDDTGSVSQQTTYHEAFVRRYAFPRFDRENVAVVSERVWVLTPFVKDAIGNQTIFDAR